MRRPALCFALVVWWAFVPAPAHAKHKHAGATGAPKARGHHCEVQGREVDEGKKQCRKAGGVWVDGPPHVTPQPTGAPPAAR